MNLPVDEPRFDETNLLWDTFIRYHTHQLQGEERKKARNLLFGVHFGNGYDMTYAMDHVQKLLAFRPVTLR